MTRVKKIGVMSCAKLYGLFGVAMGLIFGIVFFIIGSLVMSLTGSGAMSSPSTFEGILFGGVGGIIVLPVIYGVLCFISGLIGAALYNVFASWIGGLEIELGENVVVAPKSEQPKM